SVLLAVCLVPILLTRVQFRIIYGSPSAPDTAQLVCVPVGEAHTDRSGLLTEGANTRVSYEPRFLLVLMFVIDLIHTRHVQLLHTLREQSHLHLFPNTHVH